jgi:hypothetical protein
MMEEAPAAIVVITDTSAVAPNRISHRELLSIIRSYSLLGNGRTLIFFLTGSLFTITPPALPPMHLAMPQVMPSRSA